jgi:hypothetical protein
MESERNSSIMLNRIKTVISTQLFEPTSDPAQKKHGSL